MALCGSPTHSDWPNVEAEANYSWVREFGYGTKRRVRVHLRHPPASSCTAQGGTAVRSLSAAHGLCACACRLLLVQPNAPKSRTALAPMCMPVVDVWAPSSLRFVTSSKNGISFPPMLPPARRSLTRRLQCEAPARSARHVGARVSATGRSGADLQRADDWRA